MLADLVKTIPRHLATNSFNAAAPELMIGIRAQKGRTLFVNSAAAAGGNGFSWDGAVTTLQAAIGLASAGEVILIAPGHSESVIAAGTITVDKALTIIGMGVGRNRPTFNFTTATTATFLVTANNVTLINLYFNLTGIDALATGLSLSGADITVAGCEFLQAAAAAQALVAITTDDDCDRLQILDNYIHGAGDTTALTAGISMVGGDDWIIARNRICGYYGTTGNIAHATTASVNGIIDSNVLLNRTANADNKCIVLEANSVVFIVNNRMAVVDAISPAPVTAAAGFVGGNYIVGAVGVTAAVLQ